MNPALGARNTYMQPLNERRAGAMLLLRTILMRARPCGVSQFAFARRHGIPQHFTDYHQPGATRVARYRPVPGRYKGCIPYIKGQTFWAW